MSQENKIRIHKYVHLLRQSWEEGGISGWMMEHFHFLPFSMLPHCCEHSESWTKEKPQPAATSFLWTVTAEVCGLELLSLDNRTTNSGINNFQTTVQAKL